MDSDGVALHKWRTQRKYSQQDLAAKLNVSSISLSRWENGHKNPNWTMVWLALSALEQLEKEHGHGRDPDPKA